MLSVVVKVCHISFCESCFQGENVMISICWERLFQKLKKILNYIYVITNISFYIDIVFTLSMLCDVILVLKLHKFNQMPWNCCQMMGRCWLQIFLLSNDGSLLATDFLVLCTNYGQFWCVVTKITDQFFIWHKDLVRSGPLNSHI